MSIGTRQRNLALLAGSAILLFAIAAKEEIYFAFNRAQMSNLLNQKHVNPILKLPTNGKNQEASIKQIQLLKSGGWRRFLASKQAQLLNEKLAQLTEGVKRRELIEKFNRDQNLAVQNAAESERKRIAEKSKMAAIVTRYLLDAPPKVTQGEASYNDKDGYIEFYNENDGGHRYNHRCFRNGSVSENDSITTKGDWENEPDYTCSIDFAANGSPVSLSVKSLSNQGFVALTGNFSLQPKQDGQAMKPSYCKQILDDQKRIIDLLNREQITAADGEKRLSILSAKAAECY